MPLVSAQWHALGISQFSEKSFFPNARVTCDSWQCGQTHTKSRDIIYRVRSVVLAAMGYGYNTHGLFNRPARSLLPQMSQMTTVMAVTMIEVFHHQGNYLMLFFFLQCGSSREISLSSAIWQRSRWVLGVGSYTVKLIAQRVLCASNWGILFKYTSFPRTE